MSIRWPVSNWPGGVNGGSFDWRGEELAAVWLKAEKEIDALAQKNPQLKLDFWRGVDDFAGEILPAGKRGEEIVSFDLLDNLISLTRGGIGKYLYHQQEALWNKIFIEYLGRDKLNELIETNIIDGFIKL